MNRHSGFPDKSVAPLASALAAGSARLNGTAKPERKFREA